MSNPDKFATAQILRETRLTEVRNIGSSIASVITEIHETGTAKMLEKLKAQFPPGILELGAIPGLSVKKVEALHEALGISSLADLRKACAAGAIRTVKGFSEKSEKTIAEAIVTYGGSGAKHIAGAVERDCGGPGQARHQSL